MTEYIFYLVSLLDLDAIAARRWQACVVEPDAIACNQAQCEWLEAGNAAMRGIR